MLQRLLDRLQRRQRVIRLLLARQPMLRQTAMGRRMVRAYGYQPAEPSAYYPAESEFLQPQLGAEPQFALPEIAELLPEPFSDAPVQAPARLPVAPPAAVRQQPVAAPATGTRTPAVAQPMAVTGQPPIAARQQAPAPIPELSTPGVDVAPSLAANQPAPAAIVDQPTQPSAPIADRVAPIPSPEATGAPAPSAPEPVAATAPARRRRGQFVELPVSPEVARSLAQAAGDRSAAGQPTPSATPANPAAASAPSTAAELFTSTPARSPEEWGRMLAGEANPQSPPEAPTALPSDELPIAEADSQPALAPDLVAEVEAAGLAAAREAIAPAAPSVTPIPAQPIAEALMPAETIDAASVPVALPASPAELMVSDATVAERAPSLDALLQAATAPLPVNPAAQPVQQAAAPTVSAHLTQPSTQLPVAAQPGRAPVAVTDSPVAIPASPASAAVAAPLSAVPATPVSSAMQRTIERVSEVLRREAQAAQQESAATAPPSDQALLAAATADTLSFDMGDNRSLVPTPTAAQQDSQTAAAQLEVAPQVELSAPAPQAIVSPAAEVPVPPAVVEGEPSAASATERPPSRRSRFEEIPASARQPAPPPPTPSGDRRLNPRPWIPQRPGDEPAGPRMSDELFQEGSGRSPQDWSKLLFEATHPNAWKRLSEPEPAPPVTPSADQSSAPTSRPAAAAPQRQDVNRPMQTRAGRLAAAAALQPRAQALPTAQATPLRDSTRRFLRPIVGIDPGDVRIYRGAEGARITEALGAEGASTGATIALGPGHEDESRPETLGLLAHELTHTARSGNAQFVPPIAQGGLAPAAGEEQVARAAERQAVQAARRFVAPSVPAGPTMPEARLPEQAAPPGLWGNGPTETIEAHDRSYWGELPAPWEPLPDWMNGPSQTPTSQYAGGPLSSAPTPAFPSSPSGFAAGDAVPAVPATYLAEINREITTGETQAQSSPQPQQAAPAPDLDAMARQVYDMLKQRLAAERRRLG